MQIITRSQWGARAPKSKIYLATWSQRTHFTVHYSAANPNQSVRSIQNFQMDSNGWPDIGYNMLVDSQGRAYEGRFGGLLAIGAHARYWNTRSFGVCFIGRNGDDTPAARSTIREIYDMVCTAGKKDLVKVGHRDVNETHCPGDILHTWVHQNMPTTLQIEEPSSMMKMILVREASGTELWVSNLMYRIPVTSPEHLGNILWQTSGNGFWPGSFWHDGEVNVVADGQLDTWGADISPLEVLPIEITDAQLAAIAAAAEAGAAAGSEGATPEQVKQIIDEQLDQAFRGGADDDL